VPRTVWVDRPVCNGCFVCVEMCPDVFELDEDMVAVVHNLRGDTEDSIQEAIDACPEGALQWRDRKS